MGVREPEAGSPAAEERVKARAEKYTTTAEVIASQDPEVDKMAQEYRDELEREEEEQRQHQEGGAPPPPSAGNGTAKQPKPKKKKPRKRRGGSNHDGPGASGDGPARDE